MGWLRRQNHAHVVLMMYLYGFICRLDVEFKKEKHCFINWCSGQSGNFLDNKHVRHYWSPCFKANQI